MRYLLVAVAALFCVPAIAEDLRPRDAEALERRVIELERRLQAVLDELREIRRKLAPPIITPQEAFDSFHRDPGKLVTVEFGVRPGLNVHFSDVDYSKEPIDATWDSILNDQQLFTATLTPEVWRALRIPGKDKFSPPIKPPPGQEREMVMRHIGINGIRVTGYVRCGGHAMTISDPSRVVLFLTQQPGSELYYEP